MCTRWLILALVVLMMGFVAGVGLEARAQDGFGGDEAVDHEQSSEDEAAERAREAERQARFRAAVKASKLSLAEAIEQAQAAAKGRAVHAEYDFNERQRLEIRVDLFTDEGGEAQVVLDAMTGKLRKLEFEDPDSAED